jgi:hypothetical protein
VVTPEINKPFSASSVAFLSDLGGKNLLVVQQIGHTIE